MQIVKPNTKYPFIASRKPFIFMSVLLVITALILPFVMSPNWGTSFSGGSSILIHFEESVGLEEVRVAFEAHPEFKDVTVQHYGGEGKNGFMIKTRNTAALDCAKIDALKEALPKTLAEGGVANAELGQFPNCKEEDGGLRGDFFIRFESTVAEEDIDRDAPADTDARSGATVAMLTKAVTEAGIDGTVTFEKNGRRFAVKPLGLQAEVIGILNENFGDKFNEDTGIDEIVTVGPDVGAKFRNDGVLSILFALGLILLYIAIRFDIRYAPGAVVALGHDVMITFGIITVTQMEVTLETVAALLAIVGYSLNDTIVTFDRIRENLTEGTEDPLPTVVNRAINECLSRTLLTSITTFVAIIALAFVGTGVIQDFAVTLVIGILIGTYSSIFIASPVMLWMDGWLERRRDREASRRRLEDSNDEPEPEMAA